MKKQLIFATGNAHKLEEVKAALDNGFDIISLKDFGFSEEIPETGETLEANALQKARFIHERFGKDCFSDDTGLEVEALGGEPGVYSARYAGENVSFDDNIDKLLKNMADKENRSARFRTVFALLLGGKEYIFEGEIKGQIIKEKRGSNGFGYDPVFMPDGFDKTFAELTIHEKNAISHRARALAKMKEFLSALE